MDIPIFLSIFILSKKSYYFRGELCSKLGHSVKSAFCQGLYIHIILVITIIICCYIYIITARMCTTMLVGSKKF